jgi:hypothetical protein
MSNNFKNEIEEDRLREDEMKWAKNEREAKEFFLNWAQTFKQIFFKTLTEAEKKSYLELTELKKEEMLTSYFIRNFWKWK